MSQRDRDIDPGTPHHELVVEQHRQLMGHLKDLEQALEQTPDWDGWLLTIGQTFDTLLRDLPQHFELEQQGELYRTLPAERPQFAKALAALEGEHPRLLAAIEEISGRVRALRSTRDGDLGAVAEGVRQFISTLRTHEAAEGEIIAKAYWEDLGVGG